MPRSSASAPARSPCTCCSRCSAAWSTGGAADAADAAVTAVLAAASSAVTASVSLATTAVETAADFASCSSFSSVATCALRVTVSCLGDGMSEERSGGPEDMRLARWGASPGSRTEPWRLSEVTELSRVRPWCCDLAVSSVTNPPEGPSPFSSERIFSSINSISAAISTDRLPSPLALAPFAARLAILPASPTHRIFRIFKSRISSSADAAARLVEPTPDPLDEIVVADLAISLTMVCSSDL
mmetsp:Transcript_3047/g.9993  ORF Transcript_3047/g.9993 Transcript_3047/m.9993 type:complete len:242 (+) Transcript_3047:1290-2015(+)